MTIVTTPRLHFRKFALATLAAILAGGVVSAGAGSAEPAGPDRKAFQGFPPIPNRRSRGR